MTRRRKGFTLTEVLVGAAAAGLLMAVLGGFAYLAGRPTRRAQARMAGTAALAILEKRLQDDISRARGLPEPLPGGAGLVLPVFPDEGRVTYQVGHGVITRQEGDALPSRLRLSAPLDVEFEVGPGEDGRTRIRALATAAADTATVERDGSRDTRADVLLELDLPNHVFDGNAAFGGLWRSPTPG